jgi:hypothetical protein
VTTYHKYLCTCSVRASRFLDTRLRMSSVITKSVHLQIHNSRRPLKLTSKHSHSYRLLNIPRENTRICVVIVALASREGLVSRLYEALQIPSHVRMYEICRSIVHVDLDLKLWNQLCPRRDAPTQTWCIQEPKEELGSKAGSCRQKSDTRGLQIPREKWGECFIKGSSVVDLTALHLLACNSVRENKYQ